MTHLLQELVDCVGENATVKIILRFAGLRIYVPRDHKGHHIETFLGTNAAESLCSVFGGCSIEIPYCSRWRAALVALRAQEMAARGMPTDDIASAIGVTRRHVQSLLRRNGSGSHSRKTPPDLSLFHGMT